MISEPLPTLLVITVILVALASGVACIGTTNRVWFLHRIFGTGGIILTFSGVILIGLSVWGNVSLEGKNWKIRLEHVATALKENPDAAQAVVSEVVRANPKLAESLTSQLFKQHPEFAFEVIQRLAADDPMSPRNLGHSEALGLRDIALMDIQRRAIQVAVSGLRSFDSFDSFDWHGCSDAPHATELPKLEVGTSVDSTSDPQPSAWYLFTPTSPGAYTIDVRTLAEGGDPVLVVFRLDVPNSLVGRDDDSGDGYNASLTEWFTADKYYVCIGHISAPRPFQMEVSRVE